MPQCAHLKAGPAILETFSVERHIYVNVDSALSGLQVWVTRVWSARVLTRKPATTENYRQIIISSMIQGKHNMKKTRLL